MKWLWVGVIAMAWLYDGDWTGTDPAKIIRTNEVPELLHQICESLNERSVAALKGTLKFGFPLAGFTWDGADPDRGPENFHGMPTVLLGWSNPTGEIQPTFSYKTNQEHAVANLAYGSGLADPVSTTRTDINHQMIIGDSSAGDFPEWGQLFLNITLPDLTGFQSIVSAKLYLTPPGNSNQDIADVYCDIVGSWTESSSVSTMTTLSFNDATDSTITSSWSANTTKEFDILGDPETNGIAKVYEDNAAGGDVTIKLVIPSPPFPDVKDTGYLYLGNETSGNGVSLYGKDDVTYFPYIVIEYTTTAGAHMEATYLRCQLPDMSDFDVVGANLGMIIESNSVPIEQNPVFSHIYADVTDAWDETSSIGDLEALTFNDPVQTDIYPVAQAVTPPSYSGFSRSILGTSSRGVAKLYDDDPTAATPITIKLYDDEAPTDQDIFGTDLGIAELVTFKNRSDASLYWRIEILYQDPNWADPTGGGIIGQFRRAIQTLATPSTGLPDVIGPGPNPGQSATGRCRFWNFVDSQEWTLSDLLAKGDYGSTWVALDRWQNPDIWMQIKQAIEKLKFIVETNGVLRYSGDWADRAEDIYAGASGFTHPLPSVASMQETSWDAATASEDPGPYTAYSYPSLEFWQGIAYGGTSENRSASAVTEVVGTVRVNVLSRQSIGTVGVTWMYFAVAIKNNGGAGSHTVTDSHSGGGSGATYTWDSSDVGLKRVNKGSDWATSCLTPGGLQMTFTVEIPTDTPCDELPAWDEDSNRSAGSLAGAGKLFIPHSIEIGRQIEVGTGLTYG